MTERKLSQNMWHQLGSLASKDSACGIAGCCWPVTGDVIAGSPGAGVRTRNALVSRGLVSVCVTPDGWPGARITEAGRVALAARNEGSNDD